MINTLFLNNIPHYDLMMWTFMLICVLTIFQTIKFYLMIRKDFDISIIKKIKLPEMKKLIKDKKDSVKGVAS